MDLASGPGLTICPSSTFHVNGHCYTNPFTSVNIFYTMERSENGGYINYIISSEKSQMVSDDIQGVKRVWKFRDPVL
jgi:hypothetical protein